MLICKRCMTKPCSIDKYVSKKLDHKQKNNNLLGEITNAVIPLDPVGYKQNFHALLFEDKMLTLGIPSGRHSPYL